MWFKLAGATFTNNLGTMESISKSYMMDYSGLTGLSATPPNVSYADNSTPNATITFTVKEGYVFKSGSEVTASGGATGSYKASADIAAGTTFTMELTAINNKVTFSGTAERVSSGDTGTDGDDSGTVTYTITYKYQSGGVDIKTATTETVAAGTSKTFSTSNAPTIDGYTVSSVSPTSATINANTTVIYSYTAVASGSYGPNLLSNGELNEGQTLSSSSCTMTANANVYTYMYVPVEAGATYYGLNFKRCWWLDADKASLETYNGKNTSPQWTATAPSGAAYWCGCAYYTEQDLATASFAQVLS